jgi:hypothetical protein
VTLSELTLPALSVAVTVKVLVPTVAVSMAALSGTVPTQVAMPDPVSPHW